MILRSRRHLSKTKEVIVDGLILGGVGKSVFSGGVGESAILGGAESITSSGVEESQAHTPVPDRPVISNVNEESAIARRFEQILEEQLQNSTSSSLRNAVKDINTMYNTDNIEKAKLYIKSEPILQTNKHARDIYKSQPWTGRESIADSNLRMIVDSKPPPMKVKRGAAKLESAREATLDYKLNNDNFRELYKERLLGPSMLLSPSSIDLVNTIASSKINASINKQTGQFDSPLMSEIRGKPLDRDHLKNSTDNTYFMNQILSKQNVLPPWVENQKTLDGEIGRLRYDIDEVWFKWILTKSEVSDLLSPSKTKESLVELCNRVQQFKGSIDLLAIHDVDYLRQRINSVNSQIRSYNLQSPSSNLHKFKMDTDTEILKSFTRTLETYPKKIVDWHDRNNFTPILIPWGGNAPTKFEKLNLWEAIKAIFK